MISFLIAVLLVSGIISYLSITIFERRAIRVESGCGIALTGCSCSELNRRQRIDRQSAVIIPAGTWHNLVNTGNCPLKLYSIYAPPHHPFGTVHRTKADAI